MSLIAAIVFVRVVLALAGYQFSSGSPFGVSSRFVLGGLRWIAAGVILSFLSQGGSLWLGLAFWCGFVMPVRFAYWVLVPWGVPHLTYGFLRLVHFGTARDDATFYELLSRLRSGRALAPAALQPLEDRLFTNPSWKAVETDVRGASLAARAILDVLAGQPERARDLFFVSAHLRRSRSSPGTRELAQAWLLSDAFARGAYGAVLQEASSGPLTARRFFLGGLAKSFAGIERSGWKQLVLWPLCTGRRFGWRLLQRARRAPPLVPLPAPAQDGAEPTLESAQRALRAALSRPRGSVSRQRIRELASAWSSVFEAEEIVELVEARAKALEADLDGEGVGAELEEQVIELVAGLWREAPPDRHVADEDLPWVLVSAHDRITSDLLTEIETLVDSLPQDDALSEHDLEHHWRTWARIHRLTWEFETQLPDRVDLLRTTTTTPLLNHGAWLYNAQNAHHLAHEVFRWLLPRTPKTDPDFKVIRDNTRLAARA